MQILIDVDANGRVIVSYGKGVSPNIPATATLLSETDGLLIRQAKCLGDYFLVNGALVLDTAFVAARELAETAIAKYAEIDVAYNAAIGVIANPYPPTERDSWAKQEAEARAYVANNTAPTPLLSAVSAARGVPLATLSEKVIVKSDAYTAFAGALIGQRQARQDAIAAAVLAKDAAALTAVVW